MPVDYREGNVINKAVNVGHMKPSVRGFFRAYICRAFVCRAYIIKGRRDWAASRLGLSYGGVRAGRTCDFSKLLYDEMQRVHQLRVSGGIEHFLSIPS
jgi:hypothetical protein